MLKRDIPERVWIFDMEWVPDARAAKRLFDLPSETSEAAAIERLWREYGASEATPRPFLKHLLSRVVSVAFLSRNIVCDGPEQSVLFRLHSLPRLPIDGAGPPEESSIIEQFLSYLGERKPQLVGFNSCESDLQVLIQRGLINEVSAPMFCKRPPDNWDKRDYFARWENEEHLDLIRLFGSGRMKPKLNELARLCGFPGKIDVDGEQVVDLWLKGDLDAIVRYNQIDVLNTYLLWLRVVHFCGKLKEEAYAAETDQFRSFLEEEAAKPCGRHLQEFLSRWE